MEKSHDLLNVVLYYWLVLASIFIPLLRLVKSRDCYIKLCLHCKYAESVAFLNNKICIHHRSTTGCTWIYTPEMKIVTDNMDTEYFYMKYICSKCANILTQQLRVLCGYVDIHRL